MTAEPTDVRGSFRTLARRLVRESFPDRTLDEVDHYVARAEARIHGRMFRPKPDPNFGFIVVVALVRNDAPELARWETQWRFLSSAMRSALDYADMNDVEWHDSGDSVVLFVSPPDRAGRVSHFVAHLAHQLAGAGRSRRDDDRLRVRVALHVGHLIRHETGWGGSAVVTAMRLVDSESLRSAMTAVRGAALAIIASDMFYRDVVGHDYRGGLDPSAFRAVDVTGKELHQQAWIWVPGEAHPSPLPGTVQVRSDRSTIVGGPIVGDRVGGGKVVYGTEGTRDGNGPDDRR
ncbi:hypothetical protein LUPAC06_02030 [Micromonospora saelicesensis]|uniref:hypothetical protein n=1 Tax=Micromonospora saelicesensis TaxID=285676 RepID=UPI000DBF7952|nr:hypothetical protein [Micromonospora saelicesensis]RAO59082.1 hypothetical protein LUPAC06_02030 [Micromonospora saelicesensis]